MKSSYQIWSFLSILLLSSFISNAQNLMILHGDSTLINDKALIALEIENIEPFTAFQFDLVLPPEFIYVENSAQLTARKTDHAIVASLISEDTLRFIAFSPSNATFTGNDGDVLNFSLLSGPVPGNFPLIVENSLIANPAGQNIITGIINDTVFVFDPLNITNEDENMEIIIYPNPSQGVFSVTLPEKIYDNGVVKILDLSGQTKYTKLIPGGTVQHKICFSNSNPKGFYLLVFESPGRKNIYQKKIIIN